MFHIDSPNAEEALSLLSIFDPPSKNLIEGAADRFLEMGIGENNTGHVVIRSGAMGAYFKSRTTPGRWVDAYWTSTDSGKIVDVTGVSQWTNCLINVRSVLMTAAKVPEIVSWEVLLLGWFLLGETYMKVRP
jgi:hypothetical protein